jgi:hypothetical protein
MRGQRFSVKCQLEGDIPRSRQKEGYLAVQRKLYEAWRDTYRKVGY